MFSVLFFCQAEDGIRDADVTGVQTCALPILALSTSGRSKNVLAAVEVANALQMRSVGLTGEGASPLGTMVSHHLPIPSGNTTYIQQGHMAVIHVICELIEDSLTS